MSTQIKILLSAPEIVQIAKKAESLGIPLDLPTSKPGVSYRADKENWKFTEMSTQGGRNGIKRVYELPQYATDIIESNRALKLELFKINKNTPLQGPATTYHALKKQHNESTSARQHDSQLPDFMYEAARGYEEWSSNVDMELFVPVRYYTNVFGSAGPGAFASDTETEAMLFRQSFFDSLKVKPEHCFCTRVSGDSMFPTLIDRGTVLWQATSNYISEGIYLFREYEDLRIKRLRRMSASLFSVISDNENKAIYPTEELDLSRLEDYDFEIYGKYLWNCGIAK